MSIYISRNGQQLGPYTEAEILSQLTAQTISPVDLVWWSGQAGWVPLNQSSLASRLLPGVPPPSPLLPGQVPPVGQPTSGLAIAALVLGIVGFVCYPTSILLFLPAILCGHFALSALKKNPHLKGQGIAIAGLVLGYVQIVIVIPILAITVLISLGQKVKATFNTIQSQLEETQTNSPDQGTNAPSDN